MMKMIIADDESVIIHGLQKLVDWKSLGIEIVGAYEDGKHAFEGILHHKPELALLDISMPGMTGIEILKECHMLDIHTEIIFISGFQEFEYAKDAVKYGAADYLLKPVIREELLNAINRCASKFIRGEQEEKEAQKSGTETDYEKLAAMEDTSYIPVTIHILYMQAEDSAVKKLAEFSLASYVEEYMNDNHIGISFVRNGNIVAVFKGMNDQTCREWLKDMESGAFAATGQRVAFIMGREVRQMSEISGAYEECLARKGQLFFADSLKEPVIYAEENVLRNEGKPQRFENVKEELLTAVMNRDFAAFENYFGQFVNMVRNLSAGKKEDACFYICSILRIADERFCSAGFGEAKMQMKDLLEMTRSTVYYGELTEICRSLLEGYMKRIQKMAMGSEKSSYIQAKAYIDEHYSENLTLNVLAEEVHMNPYYFSSFFKKNTGENFKTYLNRVRVEHALPLLVSTNKKTYEIAVEVGFTDARNFSEAFQRYYNETPTEYRKRIREEKTDAVSID